ncbi:MAG TPA: hypothetical protein VEO74_01690, partial [Thermoanaerobaculia bacterium]|nr:hypothetical protein [Thermoanaerobaculia bacterium]
GGSGTTTTALPRLKFLVRFWRERRVEMGIPGPVRVLVLTFNRTLRGYIEELTQQQIQSGPDVALEVSTFAAWAQGLLARVVLDRTPMEAKMKDTVFTYRDLAANLRDKLGDADFRSDLDPLILAVPNGYTVDNAADLVMEQLGPLLDNAPDRAEIDAGAWRM